MNERTRKLVDCFFAENTGLEPVRDQVLEAAHVLVRRFLEGGTLLVCGNGGSCADSDHIVGELMKGFLLKRPLPPGERERFSALFGPE
ncbi:MAG TPA: SIS domain-containing protein, partial [Aminivibrio sp.]|nr:SIS domain-containing protein [Aminivibrio sp.]